MKAFITTSRKTCRTLLTFGMIFCLVSVALADRTFTIQIESSALTSDPHSNLPEKAPEVIFLNEEVEIRAKHATKQDEVIITTKSPESETICSTQQHFYLPNRESSKSQNLRPVSLTKTRVIDTLFKNVVEIKFKLRN